MHVAEGDVRNGVEEVDYACMLCPHEVLMSFCAGREDSRGGSQRVLSRRQLDFINRDDGGGYFEGLI